MASGERLVLPTQSTCSSATGSKPKNVVASVDHVETGAIVDRSRVDYRFTAQNPDGVFAVEQRAYLDVDDNGLCW